MKRVPVIRSSNVVSVGYDPSVHILEVEFHGGAIYQYAFVPPEKHAEMMKPGQSVGAFLHAHIKPNYQYRKVEQVTVFADDQDEKNAQSESVATDSSEIETG